MRIQESDLTLPANINTALTIKQSPKLDGYKMGHYLHSVVFFLQTVVGMLEVIASVFRVQTFMSCLVH